MPRYKYAGPGPVPDPEGGIVRPGDEREFAEEPVWGPWDLLEAAEADAPGLLRWNGEVTRQVVPPEAEPSGPVSVSLPTAVAGLNAPSAAEPAKEM